MSRFELYSSDIAFLTEHVRNEVVKQKLADADPIGGQSGRLAVVLDEHDRSKMIDDLGRLLVEIGLLPSSEPNGTGLRIEALIDTFNLHEVEGRDCL
ncbi:MAG: hypothetical protein O2968_11260 [Acidobacteria bacterium]|nr:hypothetical protein [Acidobacteriota bacterium]